MKTATAMIFSALRNTLLNAAVQRLSSDEKKLLRIVTNQVDLDERFTEKIASYRNHQQNEILLMVDKALTSDLLQTALGAFLDKKAWASQEKVRLFIFASRCVNMIGSDITSHSY